MKSGRPSTPGASGARRDKNVSRRRVYSASSFVTIADIPSSLVAVVVSVRHPSLAKDRLRTGVSRISHGFFPTKKLLVKKQPSCGDSPISMSRCARM